MPIRLEASDGVFEPARLLSRNATQAYPLLIGRNISSSEFQGATGVPRLRIFTWRRRRRRNPSVRLVPSSNKALYFLPYLINNLFSFSLHGFAHIYSVFLLPT